MGCVTAILDRPERARPPWVRRHRWAWAAAVATVCFGAFMGQLDASVVALTYRNIGADFGAGLGSVQWVSLSYLAVVAGLLVPVGRLSDRIGRKRVYLWGFATFSTASLCCALAPNLPALIGLRAVQGIGAAMLQANSIALITATTPRGRLRTTLGVQAAAQAVGLALGPTLGGIVVSATSWRWVFAINVPVGVLAWLAGRWLLPRSQLVTGSLSTAPHPGGWTGLGRAVRAVLTVPGSTRRLFGAAAAYLVLFGPIVLVPAILLDRGASVLHAGLVTAALPAGFALTAPLAERLRPRAWSPTRWARIGLAVTGVGLLALALALRLSTGWCPPALVVIGAGLGVFTPANNASFMRAVTDRFPNRTSLAGGLVSTARAVGTAGGTAVVAGTLALGSAGWPAVAVLLVVCVAAATSG
jgi:MFS family permease